MPMTRFEWDPNKDLENQQKHGVAFNKAQCAFADPHRVIAEDVAHSEQEQRYYCFGKVGGGILTVRFTCPRRRHSHHWRRILAKRKGDL